MCLPLCQFQRAALTYYCTRHPPRARGGICGLIVFTMEDNLKRLVSEVTRLSREAGVEVRGRTCWTHNSVACDMANPGHCFQIDPNVIAYVACLQEVQKSWEDVTAGASISSGAYGPALIASLAQLLCQVLHQKDVPYLATAKMQVWRTRRTGLHALMLSCTHARPPAGI